MHGGAADRSGLIHVGDEVIEVNGINVEGKTPADVLLILVRINCLLPGIRPIKSNRISSPSSKTLRER